MFDQDSYNRHNDWYNKHFPTDDAKAGYFKSVKSQKENNISNWLQNIFFNSLDPLLNTTGRWLTVGDAYGFDAQYIISKGSTAVATDLNTDLLSAAKNEGVIDEFAAENAEKLSFADSTFDYILCKESYHHFPRPYAALYEMIRVAKKGIVIIEPQDPISKIPLLLFIANILSKNAKLLSKIWKNRFSYEPVGNFVYKVSEREFEKFAAGLNLRVVAFKKLNPNFYFKGAESREAKMDDKKFRTIKLKKTILDTAVKLGMFPGQVLATVVFKDIPDDTTLKQLKDDGYNIVNIPLNPYL